MFGVSPAFYKLSLKVACVFVQQVIFGMLLQVKADSSATVFWRMLTSVLCLLAAAAQGAHMWRRRKGFRQRSCSVTATLSNLSQTHQQTWAVTAVAGRLKPIRLRQEDRRTGSASDRRILWGSGSDRCAARGRRKLTDTWGFRCYRFHCDSTAQ